MGAEVTPSIRESQLAIESAFKSVLDDDFSFKNFSNEKIFLSELSNAVAESKIVVLCADPSLYKAFKTFVANAFNLKMKANKTISKAIISSHPELDDEAVFEQALIPAGASPLVSEDGLYSGYGIKAKKQLLIVLPLDDKRIDYIINAGLYPFVRANMDMSVFNESDPLKDVTKPDFIERPKKSKTSSMYDVQIIKDTVKKLSSKGLTVAVANTKTVDFLGNISTSSVDLSKVVFISDYTCEKGDMSAREYAIHLANGALLNSSNSVGAAITKVFSIPNDDGTTQYFMYVCIADKENANVAKLIAEPDDTPPMLIYKAVEELFKMLSLWSDTGYAMPQFTDDKVVKKNIEAHESDEKIQKMKIAVSAIIAGAAIASTLISVFVQNVYGVL